MLEWRREEEETKAKRNKHRESPLNDKANCDVCKGKDKIALED